MNIIAISQSILKSTGLLKAESYHRQSLRDYLWLIWLCIISAPEAICLVLNHRDIDTAIEISYILVASVLCIIHTILFIMKQNTLLDMLSWLQQNYNKKIKVQANRHYLFAENVTKFCCKLYVYIIFGNIAVVCTVPLLVTSYYYAVSNEMTSDMWFLPVPMITVSSIQIYLMILLAQSLLFGCVGLCMIAFEGIFLGLSLHIIVCFRDIEIMLSTIQKDSQKYKSKQSLENHLRAIVTFHIETVNVLKKFMQFASGLVFFAFFTIIFIMTIVGLRILHPSNITDTQTNQRIKFIFVCVSGLSTLLIYAFLGSQITYEAAQVIKFAYQTDWYNYPLHLQTFILFIIMNAQKPKILTGLKLFSCTLAAYKEVINIVVSVILILEQMDNK